MPFPIICAPIYDHAEPTFVESVRNCLDYHRAVNEPVGYYEIFARLLDYARRELTRKALSIPNVTHVCFVDGDESFEPHAFSHLVAHDKDIITGLYFARRHPHEPLIYREQKPVFDFPNDQVIEIDSCGGGALVIKREVFDIINQKFDKETWWDGEVDLAGDECFAARAKACGFKLYCDTGCRFGHVGKINIDAHKAKLLGGW